MTVILFDTLAYAKKLRLSGISEEQAEAMTEAMSQVLETKDIATKQAIKDSELLTKQAIKDSELRTKQDIKALEASTKISLSEAKVEIVKWMVGMMLTQTGILIGAMIASFKIFL